MTFVARNIDEVLARLAHIVEESKARRSRLGYFATLYRQVTLEVKRAIDEGRFQDGPRMDRFDTAFGNRYFEALAAWEAGREPPKCWRVTFDLLTSDDTIILQHLLLGVNAHINLDLAVAAASAAPGAQIAGLSQDYNLINDILFAVLAKVQEALNDVSPFMFLLDELGGRSDEWALDFSIRTARAEAWNNALLLAHASGAPRSVILTSMDLGATLLARLIARPAGILRPGLQVIRHKEKHDVALVIERLNHAL